MNAKLQAHCDTRERKARLANALHVDVSTVYRWCSGTSRPSHIVIEAIARATRGKVPVESWEGR